MSRKVFDVSHNLAGHFLLRDDVVFLNHGSFGACPRPVFAAYQDWQRELEYQPVEFLGRRYSELMRETHEAVAPELGASPDDFVWVTNATLGLNIVLQSLKLQPGDEIVTSDHEYAALDKTLAYVAQRTGARIVVANIPLPLVSEDQFTQAVLDAITPRTRVLFISHITSPTALLFPIGKIVAHCRDKGIITVIDGAHAPGHIRLDLDALGADFYSGNFHKWLMTPKGSAFLHARREMQHLIDPLVVSHGWTETINEPGAKGAFGNTPFLDTLEVQGTRDPAAFLAVPAAIAFRKEHDWDAVAGQCALLARRTAERFSTLTGLDLLSASAFSAPQMAALPLPACDTESVQLALRQRYRMEIPVFSWQDRHIARLSVQGYNSPEQLDRLIEALDQILNLSAQ